MYCIVEVIVMIVVVVVVVAVTVGMVISYSGISRSRDTSRPDFFLITFLCWIRFTIVNVAFSRIYVCLSQSSPMISVENKSCPLTILHLSLIHI